MNRLKAIALLVGSASLLCAIPLAGYSAEEAKPETPAKTKPSQTGGPTAGGHRRGSTQIMLENAEGATITLWKPNLGTQPLKLSHGGITVPPTGMDNYHAIVATKDWGSSKEAVIRYEYLRGKPSGHSTRELTAARKADFEVVPQPVPREHWRYYSDQTWSFMTRFGDQPVGGVPVSLQTSNGSTVDAVSNERGVVKIKIPDDFPNVTEGERDMRDAEFMLMAEYAADGITYQTALSASYSVNQAHWKSLELGMLVVGLGMITGGFIGRVRKDKGNKA